MDETTLEPSISVLAWRGEHRLESHRVRVAGFTLHALTSTQTGLTEGRHVVLVHGFGMSSRYMMPLAEHLSRDFRVYAPDLPWLGLSSKPSYALTVPELAEALAASVSAMNIPRAAFIGNSLGCEIHVEFALWHPERVARLVLHGPTPDPKDRSAVQKVASFAATSLFERCSLNWIALTDYPRCGIARYVARFRDMMEHLIEPKLPLVKASTLIVWGTRDFIVPRRPVERYERLLPSGRLVVVPGADHGMNYSHPKLLREAAFGFLLGI